MCDTSGVQLPDVLPTFALDFERTTWRFWNWEAHFLARPDNRPLDWMAIVLDHDGTLKRGLSEQSPYQTRERLRATLLNEGFCRVVPLASGEHILLHRAQTFVLSGAGELARAQLRGARWSQTRFLLETPIPDLQTPLKRERARPTSDLYAAFEWLSKPASGRLFFGLQWTTGDGATLRRLIYAAFWSCAELWEERDECEYRLTAVPGCEFGAETSFVDWQGLPRPRYRSAPSDLARTLQKIVARNRPFLPRGVRLNREIGVGPLTQRETTRVGTLRFHINAPNAHERLEARLGLREWLRDEAPELLGEWL